MIADVAEEAGRFVHLVGIAKRLEQHAPAARLQRNDIFLPAHRKLPDTDRIRFEAHLAECDRCAGYLEDMRRLVGSLNDVAEPPPDPETRQALTRAFRDLRGDT